MLQKYCQRFLTDDPKYDLVVYITQAQVHNVTRWNGGRSLGEEGEEGEEGVATSIPGLYGYVPRDRVGFLRFSVLK